MGRTRHQCHTTLVPLVRTGPTRAPRGTIATVAVYRHRLYALGVVGPVLRAYLAPPGHRLYATRRRRSCSAGHLWHHQGIDSTPPRRRRSSRVGPLGHHKGISAHGPVCPVIWFSCWPTPSSGVTRVSRGLLYYRFSITARHLRSAGSSTAPSGTHRHLKLYPVTVCRLPRLTPPGHSRVSDCSGVCQYLGHACLARSDLSGPLDSAPRAALHYHRQHIDLLQYFRLRVHLLGYEAHCAHFSAHPCSPVRVSRSSTFAFCLGAPTVVWPSR
jgi:hypothetical protein